MSGTLPGTRVPVRGCSAGQLGGAGAHVVGQQQFAARHRDHGVDVDLGDRALVGDREHPHLGDLVAPELDAHRVLGGRREDVEDAAAHRELAALADHVHAGVGQLHQSVDDAVEVGVARRRVRVTGSISARSGAIGCSSERTVVTTTRSGGPSRSSSGWASRRSTIIRAPTVSTPGESRSCGSVSHDGNIATASPKTPRNSAVRSSASRPVAVTTSSGPAWASALATNSRALGRADQREFGGSVGGTADDVLQRRIAQCQLNQPSDRGLDITVPDAVMMQSILGNW